MGSKRKSAFSWLIGIPFVLGILAMPMAIRAAGVLVLSGSDALTLVYPLVQIVKSPLLGLPGAFANPAAQSILYLQFPMYGLMMSGLLRSRSFLTALGGVVFFHSAGVFVAYLLLHVANPYLNF